MLRFDLIQFLENELSEETRMAVRLLNARQVSGGSINDCYRVETSAGQFFLKVNSTRRYPGMFEAEAKGLKLLRAHSDFVVPDPILVNSIGPSQILVMEWLESGTASSDHNAQIAVKLAGLHKTTRSDFGIEHSNYIGSLVQSNSSFPTWAEFFLTERLQPQIKLAYESKLMSKAMIHGFDLLESKLDSIFPIEPPSLLHGDLWGGNKGISADGRPSIFDPAVYYGHREMDLGMMNLFGGFGQSIFDLYHEVFPLESEWERRIPICQLYPLMVHVNLFGSGYCQQVEQALSKV